MKKQEFMEKYSDYLDLFDGCMSEIYCSEGWIPLLCDMMEEMILLTKEFKVRQIKEKFGKLRVHIDSEKYKDDLHLIIVKYEHKSNHICEMCGSDGVLRKDDYGYATLCDSCYVETFR